MMPFIAKWMEQYALEWLKDHLSFLPELIASQREDITKLENNNTPLWPLLSQELRDAALKRAYPYVDTILALNPDDMVDIILEDMEEHGISVKREWLKDSLLAFRKDLQAAL